MKLLIRLGFKLGFVPIFYFPSPRSRNFPDLLAVYQLGRLYVRTATLQAHEEIGAQIRRAALNAREEGTRRKRSSTYPRNLQISCPISKIITCPAQFSSFRTADLYKYFSLRTCVLLSRVTFHAPHISFLSQSTHALASFLKTLACALPGV